MAAIKLAFMKRLDLSALAYTGATLGSSIINSVFMFYYVKVFLNGYKVTEWWFQVAQTLFIFWNALNDPLFGYCQDNVKYSFLRSRRQIILSGSFLFSLSFLVPWFPWTTDPKNEWLVGLHLVTALFFYDAMFTYVLLAHSCLFTELSSKIEDRIRLIKYNQIVCMIGTSSVFICETVSHNLDNYGAFQIACVALAFISWQSFRYTGNNCHTEWDIKAQEVAGDKNAFADKSSEYSWWERVKQLFTNPNFLCIIALTLFSDFHRNYVNNFMAILGDSLIPEMSSFTRSCLYGATSFLPQLLVIFSTPLLTTHGYYNLWGIFIVCKVFIGPCMYLIGRHVTAVYALYLCADKCLAVLVGMPFALALSDVIDDDRIRHSRNHPISAMAFAGNAIVCKPAQSLAPMITVAIFNSFKYGLLPKDNLIQAASDSQFFPLFDAMFAYSCWIPCIIGIIQLGLWRCYQLRHTHKTISQCDDGIC